MARARTATVSAEPVTEVWQGRLMVTLLSDGRLWVAAEALAEAFGAACVDGPRAFAREVADRHKVKFVEGVDGAPGFELGDYIELVRRDTEFRAEHTSRWERYVEYRDRKRQEATERREAEARDAYLRALDAARAQEAAEQQRRAQRAQQEAEEKARRRERLVGAPTPFESWKGDD